MRRALGCYPLLLALMACQGSCLHAPTPSYPEAPTTVRDLYALTVQVEIHCFGGGGGYGSGVIVSPRHVITAGHVARACEETEPLEILVHLRDEIGHDNIEVVIDGLLDEKTDAARLVVVGTGEPFEKVAQVRNRNVQVGALVCLSSFDTFSFSYRCGFVTGYADGDMMLGMQITPGNSGGPIWYGDELVGIIVAGTRLHPSNQGVGRAVPVDRWRSLLSSESRVY